MCMVDNMNSRRKKNMKKNITAWLLVAPALMFMLLFTVYPIIRSVYLSLSEYKLGMSEPLFVGADNYIRLFRSDTFWKVMRNTIVFALMTVLPSMGMGLMLAMLVNRKTRGVGFIRTAYFYPAIMPMIAIASVWLFIYMAKNGLFDQLLTRFNISPMNVLSNKNTVLPAMAVIYVWKGRLSYGILFIRCTKCIGGYY